MKFHVNDKVEPTVNTLRSSGRRPKSTGVATPTSDLKVLDSRPFHKSDIELVNHYLKGIMNFSKLFKPRVAEFSEGALLKNKKTWVGYLELRAPGDSALAVKWFRGEVFKLHWESFLYPDREKSSSDEKVSILSISAPSESELRSRISTLKEQAPDELKVRLLSDPLGISEYCSELLALGAQKEGGLR